MKINLISLIAAQLPVIAIAATVKNLVVFGDSNSDAGNSQRWSNGPIWSEYLSVGWNASLYSFAFSGSVCDNSMYNTISEEDRVPSLKDQMEYYYKLNLNLDPKETVYAFWFGNQDVFEMSKRHGKREPDYKEIVDCIGQELRTARKSFLSDRFLVLNVPPLDQMPYYQESEVAMNRSQAAVDINKGLEKDVANLNKHHHALEMDYVDIHSLINDIIVDPIIFNFKKPIESYLNECKNEPCKNNVKDYIWWDKTHFTTAFHKLIAKSIIKAESYMPRVEITKEIEKQLDNSQSKFHSPVYNISASNDGTLEEVARLFDVEKATPTQPDQPLLKEEEVEEDKQGQDTTSNTTFIVLSVLVIIIGLIIAYIKYPNSKLFSWIPGNKDRGKFIPVSRVEDV